MSEEAGDLELVDVNDEARVIEVLEERAGFSPRQAEVYAKREFFGKAPEKIAGELDLKRQTVSNYLSDARDKVKDAEEMLDVIEQLKEQKQMIEDYSSLEWSSLLDEDRAEAMEAEYGSPDAFLKEMTSAIDPKDIREHYPEIAEAIDLPEED